MRNKFINITEILIHDPVEFEVHKCINRIKEQCRQILEWYKLKPEDLIFNVNTQGWRFEYQGNILMEFHINSVIKKIKEKNNDNNKT